MKARVKPIMKEPYMPKVREVDGTKHQMSREDYRQYARANPQKRAEMLTGIGRGSAKITSIMENFKAAMEEHKEIARKNSKPILSGIPMEEEVNEPTTWDDIQKELFTDKEIEESEKRVKQMFDKEEE